MLDLWPQTVKAAVIQSFVISILLNNGFNTINP
mgnify:CR=1 FL=1